MDGESVTTTARRRSHSGWIIRGIACLALLLAGMGTGHGQARDVIGDDERDMFVGSGSLILPVGIPRPGRESAASCPGCSWKATLACDPVSPTACRGQARLCPDDHSWLKISLQPPGGTWQPVGSACFDPGGPVSRDRFERTLTELLEQAVPPLVPRHHPPTGVLPHLPVIFDPGQEPGPMAWAWPILGIPVSVQAQPSWSWQFTSGGPVTVGTDPGRPEIRDGVAHTYRTRGIHQVTVQTTWSARYTVGDLGPLVVAQPVTQVGRLPLAVGEGRALLVR